MTGYKLGIGVLKDYSNLSVGEYRTKLPLGLSTFMNFGPHRQSTLTMYANASVSHYGRLTEVRVEGEGGNHWIIEMNRTDWHRIIIEYADQVLSTQYVPLPTDLDNVPWTLWRWTANGPKQRRVKVAEGTEVVLGRGGFRFPGYLPTKSPGYANNRKYIGAFNLTRERYRVGDQTAEEIQAALLGTF